VERRITTVLDDAGGFERKCRTTFVLGNLCEHDGVEQSVSADRATPLSMSVDTKKTGVLGTLESLSPRYYLEPIVEEKGQTGQRAKPGDPCWNQPRTEMVRSREIAPLLFA